MTERRMTNPINVSATFHEKPSNAIPRAVPHAGGFSVSITTITNIENPTASASRNISSYKEPNGMKEKTEPKSNPVKCPPITFRGLAVTLFGMAKMINTVAPI